MPISKIKSSGIEADSVTGSSILDGTVDTADLAAGAVTSAKLDTNIAITGDLTVDTDTLHVDSANNRVGIGTSSPSSKLHIDESAAAGTGILITNDNNISGTYSDIKWQYSPSDASYGSGIRFKQLDTTHGGQLEFFTDNTTGSYTQRMTITEDGNIGIGTNSPIDRLTVGGSTDPRIAVRMTSGGTDNTARMIVQTNSTATSNGDAFVTFDNNQTSTVGTKWMVGTDSSAAMFKIAAADVSHFNGTNEYLRIDSSGRVTIPNQPAASASYTGGNISGQKIPLNANNQYRGGMSIDNSNNRINVPVSGWYKIGFHHLAYNSSAQVSVYINGTMVQGSNSQQTSGGNGSFSSQIIANLSANDYIEWYVGATNAIHGNSTYNTMYAHLLG